MGCVSVIRPDASSIPDGPGAYLFRDADGRVVYVGTFSKTMLPTLRLGFLVPPASLRPVLRKAKQLTDWHPVPFLLETEAG